MYESLHSCLNVPSRLKGIETYLSGGSVSHVLSLNVPSRLKGIETLLRPLSHIRGACLNVPSRLKGIETLSNDIIQTSYLSSSECAFPFEGN